MSLCEKRLDELGSVARGRSRHRPRNDPVLYGGAYPFVQTGDIKIANLMVQQHSQSYNHRGLLQSRLWPAGTLCITIAANIAESAILSYPACFPDSIVGFTADPDLSDVRFVKYSLDMMKSRMQAISHGTTQDNLSVSKLLSFAFPVPPLPTQRKIAAILSAYDDLIENNTRRIQILEDMARAIYREWFVEYRFPGHEDVAMVESELGPVPEGWEVVALADVTKLITRGVSPKYEEDGPTVVINQRCIRQQRLKLSVTRRSSKTKPLERFVRVGDVLINSTGVGTLGRVAQVREELPHHTVDTHVTIVRAAPTLNHAYFGMHLMHLQEHFERQGRGATGQTELSKASVQETRFLLADLETQQRFSDAVGPLLHQAHLLESVDGVLAATRDLLLPRLVSGELDVSDLDIDMGEAA